MDYFPSLPVLDDVTAALISSGHDRLFRNVVFVCAQHLLDSTGSLLESLIRLGAHPADIFVLGKRYSSSSEVLKRLHGRSIRVEDARRPRTWQEFGKTFDHDVQQLWKSVSELRLTRSTRQVVIIDDGGHCILNVPKSVRARANIAAVEQTTSGLRKISRPPCPVVNVASSAVKKYIEAPLVAETVLRKSVDTVPELHAASSVGLIGLGNVGTALATTLWKYGKQIYTYDTDTVRMTSLHVPTNACDSVAAVLKKADVIFGCTGEDLPIRRSLFGLGGHKVLISCSSEDREFNTLVQQYYRDNPRAFSEYDADIPLKYGPTYIRIIRGGFPVNFDGSSESVPNDDIQITRGLLLGAVAQTVLGSCGANAICDLDIFIQQFVLNSWLNAHPEKERKIDTKLLQYFASLSWIERESGAFPVHSSVLRNIFECKSVGASAATA